MDKIIIVILLASVIIYNITASKKKNKEKEKKDRIVWKKEKGIYRIYRKGLILNSLEETDWEESSFHSEMILANSQSWENHYIEIIDPARIDGIRLLKHSVNNALKNQSLVMDCGRKQYRIFETTTDTLETYNKSKKDLEGILEVAKKAVKEIKEDYEKSSFEI